jgi:hypothetical protein
MKIVRANGKKILTVFLGVAMVASLSPAAVSQKSTASGASAGVCCNKNLGRGNGYPVAVHVMLAGKPAAAVTVTVNTIHGVPVKAVKTDSSGVANTKLPPGDYIVVAKTKSASGMVQANVTAATPVSVTVTLTPNQ